MTEEEKKILYLQMLQEPIARMSMISSIFKGFAATIVAGVATWNYKDLCIGMLGLALVPILLFMFLDIYYLKIERKFRYWYEKVRTGERPADFLMKIKLSCCETYDADATIEKCFSSPSIWLFYIPLIIIAVIIICLKWKGVV